MEQNAFAKLEGRDFEYFMNKRRIAIGRDSKLGSVDINMGSTRFVSRKHLEISFEGSRFYLLCRGKNGIFVDDIFQRREAKRMQLPYSCIIRFPSTSIKLGFTSLMEDNGYHDVRPSSPLPPSSAFQSPYVTPLPSPTGTISVVNSCPASPGGHHHPRIPSIDLMAQYATKLLSQQEQKDRLASESELCERGVVNHEEEEEEEEEGALIQQGSSGDSSPINTPTQQDGEGPAATTNTATSTTTGNNNNNSGETSNMPIEERIGKDGKKYAKPPFSYAQLIVQALLASPDRRQTLSNIYQFISDKYPYYRLEDKGWKNSIRHNLSLNQYFMKAPREREGLGFGKGGYWCMHPDYEEKLTSQAYVKRKKKGIPVFPSAGLMSRSAPPSPTHHHFAPDLGSIKDHDNTYHHAMRPSTASHHHHHHPSPFTLSPFLPRLPSQAHSLPASPNRLPHVGHFPPAAPSLRFYPLGLHSTSTEALALESRQRIRENTDMLPASKRPCLPSDIDNKSRQIGPVIVGGANPSLIATASPQTAVFPIPQRYPFVGMPLLTQPSISFVPQQQPIVERNEDGGEEEDEEERGGEGGQEEEEENGEEE